MRRYPLADLLAATGLTESELARRAGLSGTTLVRARDVGLTESAADRYAVRCGFVPWLVWPDWLDHEIEDMAVECAAERCDVTFVPSNRKQVYCSSRCRSRESSRRRYQTSPEHAARQRERVAAYRRENARVKALKDALYRDRNREQLRAKQRERDRRAAAQRQKEAA